ncbi:outer membrane lipoprotein-sorting protein [Roseateles aquatilis]|uniref:Outer membrane lipoprotein-sorting protein n=1 Tax=Roseateles aquatilis TaxID=431061 RepID=A0A246JDL0_9BURK|nr:outer membrane lipoprotein-sorting protein [Roseateles aquatilis]OWQ90668.1 outer membrane lipoprotein-sorting protein [Roseateles aquatilis]
MSDHLPCAGRRALVCAFAGLALPRARAAVDAAQLLAQSDAIRNPPRSFALTTTLLEYKAGRQKDEMTLRAYSSMRGSDGQFRSLAAFESPAKDVGKLMLKDGTNLWLFDPSSKATIRISPQQKLLGQAANGDVVTTNFAVDYEARLDGEESITDGDRKPVDCHRLALSARTGAATYHRVQLWIARDGARPVKAQFFVESGALLKTAYYRRVRAVLGADRPTETVLIDALQPDWITLMRFDRHAWRDVPETWLQRDYLSRFRPE